MKKYTLFSVKNMNEYTVIEADGYNTSSSGYYSFYVYDGLGIGINIFLAPISKFCVKIEENEKNN